MASHAKSQASKSAKAGGGRSHSSKSSKSGSSKPSARGSGKRELIAPNGDKRYVRRDAQGQFSESDDVGRSLSVDRRQHAKTKVKPGQGDRGDQ